MNEAERRLNNQTKLQETYPAFRTRVEAVLKEMEQFGYRPRIVSAWRSAAEQLEAFRRGATKVQYGFHNVTGNDNLKEALAADIWDDNEMERTRLDFMLHLAAAAEANGLVTGIRWDLKDEDSVLIDIALKNKNWGAQVRVGWDPLHVEPAGFLIQDAKDGKRPWASESGTAAGPETPGETPKPADTGYPARRRYQVRDLDTNEVTDYTNWTTAFKPVTLLPVPYVTQLGEGADTHRNDCGAACAVMLLRAYKNVPMTPDQFYTQFNIGGDPYLSVTTIQNAMGKLGVLTNFKAGLTIPDLFNAIAVGKPLIVLIRYKVLVEAGLTEKTFAGPHFAVVVGMDAKNIYIHDPLFTRAAGGEARAYPLDVFWQAWKEVAMDPNFPNPERSAIIPAAGLGFKMVKRVRVKIPSLNVRSGPGLTNTIVGSVKNGQIIDVLREVNGWGEIGTDQWIFLQYTAAVLD